MTAAQRKIQSWCAEQFSRLCEQEGVQDSTESGRKTRMLDFFFLPSRISAKVQDDQGKLHRVELVFPQLSDAEWDLVFSAAARQAFLFASLLAGELPQEIDTPLAERGLSLCPRTLDEIEVTIDGQATKELNDTAPAAVLHRLIERINTEPFMMFILRGKGREEILLEVRRRRSMLPRPHFSEPRTPSAERTSTEEREPQIDVDRFYHSKPALFELSYAIRADELPAAILKRMDPLPLQGLEDEVEPRLEEAYAQIARRAQAYGLGLK
ncbi:MAG: hypothetical protein U0136_08565 [Bdellovibrionota bacterium]